MVLEVFESARRPTCHVTASLRHVRRLESARTPKKTPPSALGAHAKRAVFPRQERGFWRWGTQSRPISGSPAVAFSPPPKSRAARSPAPKNSRFSKKAKNNKSPGGIELTTTRRPQQITLGSGTMGLPVPLKEPPISPHLLMFFIVV